MTDTQLLGRFVDSSDQQAFAELVERHVHWVNSMARRMVRDDSLAADATQAAFILLSRKASSLRHKPVIATWLFNVTHYAAMKVIRTEARRRKHERIAAAMRAQTPPITDPSQWDDLAPMLDDLVRRLRTSDREAILLRFYEQKSFPEIGQALEISEEAARKRVSRAVDQLRASFARKGVTVGAATLATAMTSQLTQPASAAIVASAISATPLAASAGSAAALAKGVIAIMALSKATISIAVVLAALLLLGSGTGIFLHVMHSHYAATTAAPATQVAAEIPEETLQRWTPDVPKAWYVLSQPDYMGILLHGLPQRLGKFAVTPPPQSAAVWTGIEGGGRLKLKLEVDGDATGEILVGFFNDAKWSTDPLQVRKVPGPGEYELQNLLPGKFYVGALIATTKAPTVIGVHDRWPAPVEIAQGQTASAAVRLSKRFMVIPGHQSRMLPGWPGNQPNTNGASLVTIHVEDAQGRPVPFARVTVSAWKRSPTQDGGFLDAGTDEQGNAYFDRLEGTQFTINVARYESEPGMLMEQLQARRFSETHTGKPPMAIALKFDPLPTGSGKVSGRVHDQFGRPLPECYITLRREEGERLGSGDHSEVILNVPIISADGRYEISGLAPGEYVVQVRAFDITTHVTFVDSPNAPPVMKMTIPNESSPHVQFDIQLEAKMFFFGRALHADGSPLTGAYWSATIGPSDGFSSGPSSAIEPDGLFRIALSAAEQRKLVEVSHGMVKILEGSTEVGQVKLSDLSKTRSDPATFFFGQAPTSQPTPP